MASTVLDDGGGLSMGSIDAEISRQIKAEVESVVKEAVMRAFNERDNSGTLWTSHEEDCLRAALMEFLNDQANEHGRTIEGIRSRIKKMGLI